jgi:DNA-binding NtrC family response regulator
MPKAKILVVDDEEDARDYLSRIIRRKFNCSLAKASSGEEALLKLKEEKFDLVVLDIKMPGLSGIDVMRRSVELAPHTKFLAISAYDSNDVANAALKAGAIDFIPKPHTMELLELKLKEALNNIGKGQTKKR